MSDEPSVKRWTAKRKAAVDMDSFKGKTTVAEVARQHDLTMSEVEGWIDEAQSNVENGFRARPKDILEQYESALRETKEAALEEALIHRLAALGRVQQPLALRSDNGLIFSSRHYTATVKAYGLKQEFTTPYTPKQNGLVERFFRSLKEEYIWLHRFESLGQARAVIGRWIRHYNEDRPHQSLGNVAPRAHPALAA